MPAIPKTRPRRISGRVKLEQLRKAEEERKARSTLQAVIDNNTFSLFSDDVDYRIAVSAIYTHIDKFINGLHELQGKFCSAGAADTSARDAIALFIAEEKLRLIRLSGDPHPFERVKKKMSVTQPNLDLTAAITTEGQEQILQFLREYRDQHGPEWIAEIKAEYPTLSWIIELVATKTPDEAHAEICHHYPLAAFVGPQLKTLHARLREEIDKKR